MILWWSSGITNSRDAALSSFLQLKEIFQSKQYICQKTVKKRRLIGISRHILSYTLKESHHMYGFSKHTLSVDARRISSHARVFIDLDKEEKTLKTLYHYCSPLLFFFFCHREPLFTNKICESIHKKERHLWCHCIAFSFNKHLIDLSLYLILELLLAVSHRIPNI